MALVLALAACASNPDPRDPATFEQMQRQAFGGWIEIVTASGAADTGELLAVRHDEVIILDAMNFVQRFPIAQIARARLWKWRRDGSYGLWGTLGGLSTISHGIFLVFTLPIWIATSSIASGVESSAQHVDIPDATWDELVPWSRFPQGIPDGVDIGKFLGRGGPPGAQ
nr:hypothetical protein [Kofleriaceae bacterium]